MRDGWTLSRLRLLINSTVPKRFRPSRQVLRYCKPAVRGDRSWIIQTSTQTYQQDLENLSAANLTKTVPPLLFVICSPDAFPHGVRCEAPHIKGIE